MFRLKYTGVGIEEPVSVSKIAKGDAKEAGKSGSEQGSRQSLFCKATDPEVDSVQRAVDLQESDESEGIVKTGQGEVWEHGVAVALPGDVGLTTHVRARHARQCMQRAHNAFAGREI